MSESEVSSQDIAEILAGVSEPEEMRVLKTDEERRIAAQIIPILAGRANALAEANKAKELSRTIDELKTQNQQLIEDELKKIREAAKPPDLDQLSKLLNQEYLEVKFQVHSRNGHDSQRDFVIRELPQTAEERFLRIVQKNLLPRLREFSGIEWTNTDTVAEKLQKIVDMFPDALGIMAELCAVALDPFEEDAEITPQWVQRHLSTYRIMMVIQAQVEAGKFRDFFFSLFRLIRDPRTA